MPEGPPPPLVARGRVLPVSRPPIPDGLVLAEEGRISHAGPASNAPPVPPDAVEVDLEDGTILPGMVDAHVHLTCDGGPDLAAEVEGMSPEELTVKAMLNAVRQLEAGVVAVRDLGAPGRAAAAVGAAVDAGRFVGPLVTAAGRALTCPGGHIPYLGIEVEGADDMAAAARDQFASGAGGIKLVATGGLSTPGVPIGNTAFEEDEMAAAVAVARGRGGWVAAHCIGVEGTKRALRAGATTIEHGVFLDDETLELMRSTGAVFVPTMLPLRQILGHADEGIHEEVVAKARSVRDEHAASVRRAVAAGIPIAAGTDAGTAFNPHGCLAEEARLLADGVGLDVERVIRAVTIASARCLGRDDLGRLETGMPANLLIVPGNPDDDPSVLATPRQVVANGRTATPGVFLRPLS